MLGTTARQEPARSWRLALFYQGTRAQDLNFEVSDSANCAGGGGVTFPCSTTGRLEAEGSGDAAILKLSYQPRERGLQLYATVGAGEYRVQTGTTTVFRSRLTDRSGFLTSIGGRAVLWPDTVVTPALAVDASLGWQRYFGDDRLDLLQLQLALQTSHRFELEGGWKLEPYGGVKYLRTRASLTDVGARSRVSGRKDTVTPFAGLNIPVYEGDNLFAEASFVDGIQFAAGYAVRFG